MAKGIFSNKASRVWVIVTAIVLVVCTLVTTLALSIKDFYELLNTVMPGGGPRAVYAEGVESFYLGDYTTKADVYESARDMNQRICEEGMVLLKNKNNALPLYTPVSDKSVSNKVKISVFGKNSVNIAYGGSGSGGANTSNVINLYDALEEAGFEYNPTLKAFYDNNDKSGPARKGNSKDLDSGDTVTFTL